MFYIAAYPHAFRQGNCVKKSPVTGKADKKLEKTLVRCTVFMTRGQSTALAKRVFQPGMVWSNITTLETRARGFL